MEVGAWGSSGGVQRSSISRRSNRSHRGSADYSRGRAQAKLVAFTNPSVCLWKFATFAESLGYASATEAPRYVRTHQLEDVKAHLCAMSLPIGFAGDLTIPNFKQLGSAKAPEAIAQYIMEDIMIPTKHLLYVLFLHGKPQKKQIDASQGCINAFLQERFLTTMRRSVLA